MNALTTAIALISLSLPTSATQARTGCDDFVIAAGTINQSEQLSLTEKNTWRSVLGGDPRMRALALLTTDTNSANSFYARVPNTPALLENETLQLADEEVFYGEAVACQGNTCHLVFIRPAAQIAHRWLTIIQRDLRNLEELAPDDNKNAGLVLHLKTAYQQPESVWVKVSTLYCHLEPDGKYTDLSDSVAFCRDYKR